MITVLNDRVEDKVKFLASALLHVGTHGNTPWILGTSVTLRIADLDLLDKHGKEVVHFNVSVWGPNGNKYGSISKEFLAKEVRQTWTSMDANSTKKRIAVLTAQKAKGQLDTLYTTAEQITWPTMHTHLREVHRQYGPLLDIPHPSRNNGKSPVYLRDERFVCDCAHSRESRGGIICNHIKWALISGEDKKIFAYPSLRRGNVEKLEVPLGFGEYWLPVALERAVDEDSNKETPFIMVVSSLQVQLQILTNGGTEDKDNVFVIHEDEGIFPYIRYMEELIMTTKMFEEFENASAHEFQLGCKKASTHRDAVEQKNKEKCHRRNPYRQAWTVASIASVFDNGVCLACKLTTVSDTPDFD